MGLFSGIKKIAKKITKKVAKLPVVGKFASKGLKFLGKHGLKIVGIGLSIAAIAGTGGLALGPLAALATRFPMLGKLAASAGQLGSKVATSGIGQSITGTFGKFFGGQSAIGGAARSGLNTLRGWGSNLSSTLQSNKHLSAARNWGSQQMNRARAWSGDLRTPGSQQLNLFDDVSMMRRPRRGGGFRSSWNNMNDSEKSMAVMAATSLAPSLLMLPLMLAGSQEPPLL